MFVFSRSISLIIVSLLIEFVLLSSELLRRLRISIEMTSDLENPNSLVTVNRNSNGISCSILEYMLYL